MPFTHVGSETERRVDCECPARHKSRRVTRILASSAVFINPSDSYKDGSLQSWTNMESPLVVELGERGETDILHGIAMSIA